VAYTQLSHVYNYKINTHKKKILTNKKESLTNKNETFTNQKATANPHGKNPQQNLKANRVKISAMYAYPYMTLIMTVVRK